MLVDLDPRIRYLFTLVIKVKHLGYGYGLWKVATGNVRLMQSADVRHQKVMLYDIFCYYITLFHQFNGSINMCKKYINKYNTTTKRERKRRRKTRTYV